MWQLAAAAAIPFLVDRLTPKSDRPDLRQSMPEMPDYSKYQNQMLAGAFDPQSQLYALSADKVTAQVNAEMARRGLMNSSLGIGALQGAQTKLANDFIENATKRRQAALGMAYQQANEMARMQMGINSANAQAAQWSYGQDQAERQSQMDMFNSMAGAGAQMYGYNQQQSRADAAMARDQSRYDDYMSMMNPGYRRGVGGSNE